MNDKLNLKQAASYLFIATIAVIFTLQWGPAARGCEAPVSQQNQDVVAQVNGKEIPASEFAREYAGRIDMMRAQGSPITESLAKQLGFPKQILESMVSTELLAQEAKRRGIEPSDEELRGIIQRNPSGQFDFDRYREVLRDQRRTEADYESELRKWLASQKLEDLVANTAMVSDDEVKAKFLKDFNRASVTFVRIGASQFAGKVAAPKPAELDAWKKANAERIAADYEANKLSYHQPEKVRARHILIKTPPDATPEKKAEAKQKIENVRKEIEGGKSFAEMATEVSEDVGTKARGGDLGINERTAWVPEFANAAFALQPGELSQPVETPYGYHLIQVEEKQAPQTKALKDVESEIATRMYQQDKTNALAQAEAQKALAAVKTGKKLLDLYPPPKRNDGPQMLMPPSKPEAQESGEFNAGSESIPKLGIAPELMKDVFALQAPKPLEKIYPLGDAFVVAVVTERKLAAEDEFASQKEKLREDAIRAKQYDLRDALVKALKASGKVTTNDELVMKLVGGDGES